MNYCYFYFYSISEVKCSFSISVKPSYVFKCICIRILFIYKEICRTKCSFHYTTCSTKYYTSTSSYTKWVIKVFFFYLCWVYHSR